MGTPSEASMAARWLACYRPDSVNCDVGPRFPDRLQSHDGFDGLVGAVTSHYASHCPLLAHMRSIRSERGSLEVSALGNSSVYCVNRQHVYAKLINEKHQCMTFRVCLLSDRNECIKHLLSR